MGKTQTEFLDNFRSEFATRFGENVYWRGGQSSSNTARLLSHEAQRREVGRKLSESFELGDITTNFKGWKIVIEFEAGSLPLSNLMKYWPYIRGEMSSCPDQPVLLCHFSDYQSYATRRDLWEWTVSRMKLDTQRLVAFEASQYDHWGQDEERRTITLRNSLRWIEQVISQTAPDIMCSPNAYKALMDLEEFFPQTIHQMRNQFTSHEFILIFAQQHPRLYIEALHAQTSKISPFMIVHAFFTRQLKKYPHLIRSPGSTSSHDIFGNSNSCAAWVKLSADTRQN